MKISAALKGKTRTKKPFTFKGRYHEKSNGCWVWKNSKSTCGYGRIWYNNKQWSAHRLSYTLHKGSIMSGLFVCHTCDNPPCINPNHLFLGTHGDNMQDMMKKGRGNIAKLSTTDKDSIKQMDKFGISYEDIAKHFSVSIGVVKFVINN